MFFFLWTVFQLYLVDNNSVRNIMVLKVSTQPLRDKRYIVPCIFICLFPFKKEENEKKEGIVMDFRELNYFVTIAKTGSLTKAASQLYVTQPTLTKFIQRLEDEVGLALFQHIGKKVLLTYAGERFLSYAKQLLNKKHEMDTEFTAIREKNHGFLRVGMAPFRAGFSLPVVLPEFHQLYPNVDISLVEANALELEDLLLKGSLDLAFYHFSQYKDGIVYEKFTTEKLHAIVKKGHPVKSKSYLLESGEKAILLSDLKDETFLLQSHTQSQGKYVLDELKSHNIKPSRIMENINVRAAVSLAAGGYGVAFMSGELLSHFDVACDFDDYILADCTKPFSVAAAWRKGVYQSEYARAFINLMKDVQ